MARSPGLSRVVHSNLAGSINPSLLLYLRQYCYQYSGHCNFLLKNSSLFLVSNNWTISSLQFLKSSLVFKVSSWSSYLIYMSRYSMCPRLSVRMTSFSTYFLVDPYSSVTKKYCALIINDKSALNWFERLELCALLIFLLFVGKGSTGT